MLQKEKKKRTPDARKMLLPYVLLLLPVFVAAHQESQSVNTLDREILRNDGSKDALDWIGESFLNAVDALFPGSKLYGSVEGTLTIINICGWTIFFFFNVCLMFDTQIMFYSK